MGKIIGGIILILFEFFPTIFILGGKAGFFSWLLVILSELVILCLWSSFIRDNEIDDSAFLPKFFGIIGAACWIVGVIMLSKNKTLENTTAIAILAVVLVAPYFVFLSLNALFAGNLFVVIVTVIAKIAGTILLYKSSNEIPVIYIIINSVCIFVMLLMMFISAISGKNRYSSETDSEDEETDDVNVGNENIPVDYSKNYEDSTIQNTISTEPDAPLVNAAMVYAMDGNLEALKILINNGIDINVSSNSGFTLLRWACIKGQIETAKWLLENGAYVNKIYTDGSTVIFNAVDSKNLEFVKLLVEYGADINVLDKKHLSPLAIAVTYNSFEIVKFLIENGADVNTIDISGTPPLFYACSEASSDIVFLLLESGANVNLPNIKGVTPLMGAAMRGREDVTRKLLECGADVNATYKGETAAQIAYTCGYPMITHIITLWKVDNGL